MICSTIAFECQSNILHTQVGHQKIMEAHLSIRFARALNFNTMDIVSSSRAHKQTYSYSLAEFSHDRCRSKRFVQHRESIMFQIDPELRDALKQWYCVLLHIVTYSIFRVGGASSCDDPCSQSFSQHAEFWGSAGRPLAAKPVNWF